MPKKFKRIKAAKNDFNEDFLPSNRKEVFFDILKIRFLDLLKIGVVVFLFFIPIMLVHGFEHEILLNLYIKYNGFVENNASEEAIKVLYDIAGITNIKNLIQIPCLIIFAIGLSGIFRVIKKMVWAEGVDILQDFNIGVKQNAKQFVLVGIIVGVVNFISQYLSQVYLLNVNEYNSIAGSVVRIFPIVFFPMLLILLVGISTYNDRFSKLLKISFYLYIKSVFKSILATVLIFSPVIILYVLEQIHLFIWAIGLLLVLIFISPYMIMAALLYGFSVYHKFINIDSYPELIDKGIWRKNGKDSSIS